MLGKIFVTEHNRLARELHKLNPLWNDEYLYQEARKINIAQYQHIVYWDLLPPLIGSRAMKKWDLISSKYEYFEGYSHYVDPSVANAFMIISN